MVATANNKLPRRENVEFFARHRFSKRWSQRVSRWIVKRTNGLISSLNEEAFAIGMEAAFKKFSEVVVQEKDNGLLMPDKSFCRFFAQNIAEKWARQSYSDVRAFYNWPAGSAIHTVSWSFGVTYGSYLAIRHYADRIPNSAPAPAGKYAIHFNSECKCPDCMKGKSNA